ncbi:COG1470 family protein [Candidatus Cetobacterium colombiensis]|uniref:Pili assembly chaperone N-terminal domain-containing protein n=1 Tax=Candidatus Cetobacterium colombiensis TaxID=3073100 RepID=A0ABU4W6R5_9FUSO|nr:hypothetical protein [Candidatus Cetobacterium colombiensis]MDX8335204.1 hypothetical protein [Candidatus Cetobacterium colombiensis]
MKKNIFIILMILFSKVYPYVNIHPVTFDKNIGGAGEVQEYYLYNGTNTGIKYLFSVEKSKDKKDMTSWVEYYPKVLNLKPGQEGILKVFIKAPVGTENGEYTTVLGVKEMPVVKEKDLKSKGSSLKVLTNLKIEIVGYVGELKTNLNAKNLQVTKENNKLSFSGKIKNTGNRRGTFSFYLSDSRNQNSFLLGNKRILKDEDLDLKEFNQEIKDEVVFKNIKRYNTLLIKENDDVVMKVKI